MTTEIMKQIEDFATEYAAHYGIRQAIMDFQTRIEQEWENSRKFRGDLALAAIDRADQCDYALRVLYTLIDLGCYDDDCRQLPEFDL
jgi:hypothetical protein